MLTAMECVAIRTHHIEVRELEAKEVAKRQKTRKASGEPTKRRRAKNAAPEAEAITIQ